MANVYVQFRNGTRKEFKDKGRAGGSYETRVEYSDGVVIIIDEWGNQTIYPLDTIESVEVSGR